MWGRFHVNNKFLQCEPAFDEHTQVKYLLGWNVNFRYSKWVRFNCKTIIVFSKTFCMRGKTDQSFIGEAVVSEKKNERKENNVPLAIDTSLLHF